MTGVKTAVITITFIACVGVAGFLFFGKQLSNCLHPDVFKITYQFLLIIVAGGGISWLYKQLMSDRERKQSDIRAFRELYANLIDSYNMYKEIKRLLRARALRNKDDEQVLLCAPYEDLMIRLNTVQLKFEFYKREVAGKNQFFKRVNKKYTCSDNEDSLHGDLEKVEKYLNRSVGEYEEAFRDHVKRPEYLRLEDLKKVGEFIAQGLKKNSKREKAQKCFTSAINKLAEVADDLE